MRVHAEGLPRIAALAKAFSAAIVSAVSLKHLGEVNVGEYNPELTECVSPLGSGVLSQINVDAQKD